MKWPRAGAATAYGHLETRGGVLAMLLQRDAEYAALTSECNPAVRSRSYANKKTAKPHEAYKHRSTEPLELQAFTTGREGERIASKFVAYSMAVRSAQGASTYWAPARL